MADTNKTEQPTPRHRNRARERGQVTRSRELSSALAMAAVAGVISLLLRNAVPQWAVFFRTTLEAASSDSFEPAGPLMYWTSVETLRWVMPMFAAALAAAVITGVAQGGLLFAPQALSPKFDRISPGSRLQQLTSLNQLSIVLKSLLPFGAIAWIGYACVHSRWEQMLLSSYRDVPGITVLLGGILFQITWQSGLVLLAWAAVDYLLQWRRNESGLKMSRQEIREEAKESEGNPQTKARIRRLQRHSRRRQMLKAAETATVVITNPTHYAVALRYEINMAAPIVVAKGLDNLAARIREIAWKRNIPVMENRPLAQALYKSAEIGDPIPAALYRAVAEILVLVYRAQAEVRTRETQTQEAASSGTEAKPL